MPSKKTWKRKAIIAVLVTAVSCLIVILTATALVDSCANGRIYQDIAVIPHRPVGLILGCAKTLSDGRSNLFFKYRIDAAARLFHAGKVDHLIVSGDNHIKTYDESTDMKNALIQAGVPADRIYCDYAGFRTLDSVVRAREIFGQTRLTVISQEFHNQRAIFIARHRGVDAIGFNAKEIGMYNGLRTKVREKFARVKAFLDIYVLQTNPKYLGDKILIGSAIP